MNKRALAHVLTLFAVCLSCFMVTEGFCATYYVNAQKGRDLAGWGISAKKPFKTIGFALKQSGSQSTLDAMIKIAAGKYNEVVTIDAMGTTVLQGAGASKTIIDGNINGASTVPTVTAIGPNRVSLNRLTVQGGTYGVYCKFAYLGCKELVIRNNTNHGLYAKGNAYVLIEDSTIQSNGGHGIRIKASSAADIVGCTLAGNLRNGIQVASSAYAYLENSTIVDNKQYGIQSAMGSDVELMNSTIHSNLGAGMDVTIHSTASLWGGNRFYSNVNPSGGWQAGIQIYHGSQVSIIPDASTVEDLIYQNNGPGILVGNNSELDMHDGIVSENKGDGVILGLDSVAIFLDAVSIIDNGGYGINCGNPQGDSKYWGTPGDLSGNTLGEVNCQGS